MRDRSKCGEKKIAKTVAFEAGALREPMLKEPREQGFVFAEGDDAVTNVARRQHVKFLAQPAAGAAIVADRDHGAKVPDHRRTRLSLTNLSRSQGEALQSF